MRNFLDTYLSRSYTDVQGKDAVHPPSSPEQQTLIVGRRFSMAKKAKKADKKAPKKGK